MSTYRERREARAERLDEWAEKREARAESGLAQARQMGSIIPFGQPILVGHHSERGDRRYRDRIGRTYERAFEDATKAESMASRASTIRSQLDESIYDDDPEAIERLEARIAAREAERAEMVEANAAFRREHRAALKAMSPYERSQAVPHPSYQISNLAGSIKRDRDRLVAVKRQQARREQAEASESGVAVRYAPSGYCTVTFAEKPARDVLDALKAAGFRWAKGSWVGRTEAIPDEVKAQVQG